MPTDEELELTAYHEAGHVVACLYRGIDIEYVTILEHGARSGWTQHGDVDEETPEGKRKLAVIALAGIEGARLVAPGRCEDHALEDLQPVARLAAECGATVTEIQAEVADLLQPHRSVIDRIAAELLEYRSLLGCETAIVYGICNGTDTEQHLAEVRESVDQDFRLAPWCYYGD